MCRQMRERGIAIGENPPVWAWAQPEEYVPQLARELFSGHDWEQGIVVLHVAVPKTEVLLSSYHEWNNVLDAFLETGTLIKNERLFAVDDVDEDDSVQAALPYIHASWIIGVRQLDRE